MFQKNQTKLALVFLVLSLFLLVACGNSKADNKWLEGRWHSKEWNVTYTFSVKEDVWTISDKSNPVAKSATVKASGTKELVLEDKDGTRFVIEKHGEKELYFQQVAAEGLTGTTASVRFKKE